MSKYYKYLGAKYILIRKLGIRSCRLLAKCKQYNDSNIRGLIEDLPYNGSYEKKDISNDKKGATKKNNQSNRNLINHAGQNREAKKSRSCIFETNKYSHLEKKIFKELDYMDYLKSNKTISNETYKKVIRKKYGLRIILPILLLLLLLIPLVVDFSAGLALKDSWEWGLLGFSHYLKGLKISDGEWLSKVLEWLKRNTPGLWKHNKIFDSSFGCSLCSTAGGSPAVKCILGQLFGYIIYFVPFIILCITFISAIVYYHKKVKKYEKIKFRKK
ncbi:Plasmodium exported protein (Pm-fam-a like), unknown function [Plasmodium malariae]|uniref:Fam-l protein n=1 Tax=Plasmodium malariae TaxID=5858 RepID=A0A1A8WSS9_PLAMA|nr:Plasmodium exported protein (Pm-fam-a like), unknown function [Plasmodium malariae]